jgi:DHA2 family multidrug resistance protein-like MFS transporter
MGALGDRIGRRRLLSAGLVVFAGASGLAALAASAEQLIAARVLLGVGGAMIMPSTLSVLRNVFLDDRERATAVGVWSAVAAGGFAVGPIVGGAILEVAPWGWVFGLQVPVVLGALVAARRWVPESRNPAAGPLDPVAVGLSVAGVLALVWGVKEGGKHGFDEPAALLAVAAGAGGIAAFVVRAARSPRPLLDVHLFRDRRFATSAVAVLFTFFGLSGLLLLLSQHLQLVEGHDPLAAGVRLLPMAVAAAVAAPLTDRLVRRFGAHVVVGGGFALVAGALAALTTLEAGSSSWLVALSLAAMGLGGGVAATAGSAAILAAAPPERAGGAAAVQETAFELGGALGVAIIGSIMNAAYRDALPAWALGTAGEGLPAAAQAAETAGGSAGAALLAVAQDAFLDGFGVAALTGAVVMGLVALAAVVSMARGPGARPRRSSPAPSPASTPTPAGTRPTTARTAAPLPPRIRPPRAAARRR